MLLFGLKFLWISPLIFLDFLIFNPQSNFSLKNNKNPLNSEADSTALPCLKINVSEANLIVEPESCPIIVLFCGEILQVKIHTNVTKFNLIFFNNSLAL